MKFRVIAIVKGKAVGNGLRFDSEADANKYATDILSRLKEIDRYIIEPAADTPPNITADELKRRVVDGRKRS